MKIACLGAGAWGISLAQVLASKGHSVTVWSKNRPLLLEMGHKKVHPRFPKLRLSDNLSFTSDFNEALEGADFIIESVTSKGVREIFSRIGELRVPLIMSSKGIEVSTGMLVPEVALDVWGAAAAEKIVYLSGPSLAAEVMEGLPTALVAASLSLELAAEVAALFSTDIFHVQPADDIIGVAFGGAMKNIIAIACGIATGLGFRENCRAALMTLGMEEIRRLSLLKPMRPETLNGLAGMGDLCVTCQSPESRNYKFGRYIGEGFSPDTARHKVGMVVEGEISARVAQQLAKSHGISQIPIIEAVCHILEGKSQPKQIISDVLKGSCSLDLSIK